jgi:hypothetical protein
VVFRSPPWGLRKQRRNEILLGTIRTLENFDDRLHFIAQYHHHGYGGGTVDWLTHVVVSAVIHSVIYSAMSRLMHGHVDAGAGPGRDRICRDLHVGQSTGPEGMVMRNGHWGTWIPSQTYYSQARTVPQP